GTFQAALNTPLTFSTSGLVVADFNQDGNLDIATGAGTYPTYNVVLLLGSGNGTFQVQQPLSLVGVPLAAGDLNGDGKPDLIAAPSIQQPGANTIQSLLNNGDGTFTILQTLPGAAVALYDLLGDQKLDLIAAQESGTPGVDQDIVSIVRGNGDGTFATFPFYPGGSALAAADFNGDKRIDLAEQIVTLIEGNDYTDYVGVSLNSGTGFPPPTQIQIQGQSPYSYGAIGDFNGDGHMDLAAATSEIGILLGNGDGTFQTPVYYGAGMVGPIATGDFNNDGKLDVFGASGANVSVLLGNGDGTFGLPVNSFVGQLVPLTNVAVADFNEDKKLDAAVVIETSSVPYSQVALLLGNGDGTFSPGATFNFNFPQTAIASGDLNGDGIPDLIVAVSGGTDVQVFPASVVVFLGKGDGTFQSPITTVAGDAISTIVVADFNGDGKQDIAISNSTWGDVSLLLGNGDGTFQPPMQFSSGGGAMVVADFDGNGSPDLAVSGSGGIYLLLSTGKGGSAAFVSPTAVTFASQTVAGASAAQMVILSNTNSTALSISSITTSGVAGGDYQQSNNCGTSLAAGASCTISVTFTPQAAGTRAAAIQIANNAINSPQVVTLSGTGVASPDFTFGTASGGSSSTISAGQTATFSLALTPSGSFSGTVNLTCSITPAASPAPVCSVPGSVSVTGTSATSVTVTVSTTASGSVAGWPSAKFPISTGLIAWILALGFSSLLFVSKRSRPAMPAAIIVLAFLTMSGCGGSSSTPPSTNSKGTPAGTYTATLTATSGSLSHQVPLTVIVQ
ncbi:MAG TPA: FG-GAP-like repeat-containing protein, partial [Candidatus Acidoferrum sp.]|nr:FG-GAP-like repeat-containing protein [Candidatus Acidoferrum sp.]